MSLFDGWPILNFAFSAEFRVGMLALRVLQLSARVFRAELSVCLREILHQNRCSLKTLLNIDQRAQRPQPGFVASPALN
jgi:hypothetical protein